MDRVPIISSFFGIVVRMSFENHDPPHFHAEYQGQTAKADFDGHLIVGHVRSAAARRRLADWARVRRAGRFRIRLVFKDKRTKTVDFRPWLKGPMFAPLRDVKYFQRFFLDGGTVAWPNGADIAPEALYEAEDVGSVGSKVRGASARRGGRLGAASR